MRKPQTFFELQTTQRQHDETNHTDICFLPMFDRLNHYVLHYAKYVGRLAPKRTSKETLLQLRRTYTDAFLITLSASNALNIDLDEEMRNVFDKTVARINQYVSNTEKLNPEQLRQHSLEVLAISNGAMADTMEKRDHMDDRDSRSILTKSVIEINEMLLRGSYHIDLDLVDATLARRRQISELKVT